METLCGAERLDLNCGDTSEWAVDLEVIGLKHILRTVREKETGQAEAGGKGELRLRKRSLAVMEGGREFRQEIEDADLTKLS